MKLKELRQKTGLNQTKTAQAIGIPRLNYNKYELEQVEPDIETLCKIADFYGVSLDYLCDHETKHLIDTSNYPGELKTLINIALKLSIAKLNMLNGFALRLAQEI